MVAEKIDTQSGVTLFVEKQRTEKGKEVSIRTAAHERCVLHWGLCRAGQTTWQIPPKKLWPKGSQAFDRTAVQTPFRTGNGTSQITFRLDEQIDFPWIAFVLFFPEGDRWDNNHGGNYHIELSVPKRPSLSPASALKKLLRDKTISSEHVYKMENQYQLLVSVSTDTGFNRVTLITDMPGPLLLHWGVVTSDPPDWTLPPAPIHPVGTTLFQNKAAETPFDDRDGLRQLQISLKEHEKIWGLSFVLRQVDSGRWLKDHGRNFYIPIISRPAREISIHMDLEDLSREIIGKEMGDHSWTLMHRFNLCHDLLDRVGNQTEALALIFIWLRFSAIRQLDWQRNYNTQPRELSHAQDRLTNRLAERYVNHPAERLFIRLILTTMGRGGEGQRVRDGILNIMHRHHIKEVSGRFMEQWHQKLHNNTTPDDVVICEAYLSFLRENGNLDLFYRKLQEGGVTKKRLESYDRPITTPPDFIPHLKEALIHDFQEFLGILKGVHFGTDLGTAIHAARYLLEPDMHAVLDYIWRHRDSGPEDICPLAAKITLARRRLSEKLIHHSHGIRDLLFLDLALEDFLRVCIERSIHLKLNKDQLVDLIALMLEIRSFTDDDEELNQCRRHWEILIRKPRFSRKWSLQAHSVVERLSRVLGGFIDRYYDLLQPKAEFLGHAFQADTWTITLFTEEVVRGRPAFVLVMLLRLLNPILRKHADLGNWQIVSRGKGLGRVEVTKDLGVVQGKRYDRATIIVTDKIAGNEEIPQGITAIITPDTTDIVSHVAIRARNARVLIATCYDPKTVEHLKSLNGRLVAVNVNTAGEVIVEQSEEKTDMTPPPVQPVRIRISRPDFTAYTVLERDFNEKNVGGKSNNLKRLRNNLPEWICLPSSVALPFGIFERVLAENSNLEIAARYGEMVKQLERASDESIHDLLGQLRKNILVLNAPDGLDTSLYQTMEQAGFVRPKNWNDVWMCIKHVWSSKWNERAFLSRRAQGIAHEDLLMAVLIQDVVDADYSFVIHTVNPFSGDKNEVYAEVVLGLGETLVGNYPGRAFSFSLKKGEAEPHIHAFPSKSIGLFGGGLIFRSDSNGEDLVYYAGAGLYDSVTLTSPREVVLDYSHEPLVWDEDFQKRFSKKIADMGILIEERTGSPQDIEGACSRDRFFVVQTRPQV